MKILAGHLTIKLDIQTTGRNNMINWHVRDIKLIHIIDYYWLNSSWHSPPVKVAAIVLSHRFSFLELANIKSSPSHYFMLSSLLRYWYHERTHPPRTWPWNPLYYSCLFFFQRKTRNSITTRRFEHVVNLGYDRTNSGWQWQQTVNPSDTLE